MTEITARDPAEWENWLEQHHETEPEVWLVYWKKGSGRPSVTWSEAVEVALKFGWIDGQIRSIDEHRYKQRWTPRRPKSKWSQVNKEIALRHIASGEMRPMGMRSVEAAQASGEWDRAYRVHPATPMPADLRARLKENDAARHSQPQVSRTRWNRWLAWLEGSEGRTRSRRLNMIVRALETKDYAPVDAAVERAVGRR
ncbi:MAG TPA: hypothetical protein VFA05_10490 [Gaiellaceae bacterium]|nr:hypothetical protein [Gaiellaceae bacterium]